MNVEQLTFLVVEDHEFQRDMVVQMLRNMRAKAVHAAPDGRAALELLRNLGTGIDVVISDLDMPSMDGVELIRHLGSSWKGTALVVTSALERELLSSVETMAAAYGVECLDTVEKPVTPQKLQHVLAKHRRAVPPPTAPSASTVAFSAEQISQGIDDDQFEPFFQPKVQLATGEVVGAEALARWRHPQHGIVAPFAFVAALEASGRIDMLTRCMLRKAAAACRVWHNEGYDGTVAVNVSLKSLHDVGLADEITEVVHSQGLEPQNMVLEITESAATTELGKVLENLTRLRMRGFGLGIDDYGTGYSSLAQLTRIPFTELKIDQSFVTHAGRRESARVILAASLDMARRLKIHAVAEGVETRENWEMLVDLKCDIAQGYYIARPMPADTYVKWVESWPKMRVR